MAGRRKKKVLRNMTEEESRLLLQSMISDFSQDLGINWDNHRLAPGLEDTFRVTAKSLSLPALVHIMEHKSVKNVYFHPSVSPPTSSRDPISLRYRLYIQYEKVEDKG